METVLRIVLQRGRIEDSERIYQVHTSAIKKLCSSHYDSKEIAIWAGKQKRETYIPFLESGDIIVAKQNAVVIGFIHRHLELTESSELGITLEIKGLFIDPNCSRKGVGRLLLKEVEKIAMKNGVALMKVSASLNSLPFYHKMGFKEVERKSHQITCQCLVECVSMVKHLT